jgi:hypothetical protein
MKRPLEFLSTDGKSPRAQDDVLRRIWLRSAINPYFILSAVQSRRLVQDKAEANWHIEALLPMRFDANGIPDVFRYHFTLARDPQAETLVHEFTYANMMERLGRNYSSSLVDPLTRVTDHYEDERRREVRGQVSHPKLGNDPDDSLSKEAWARRGPV